MNFYFSASYMDALKVIYVAGIVPVYVVAMLIRWKWQFVLLIMWSIILAICFPWLIKRIKYLIVTYTSFGGIKGEFYATGVQFFSIYFLSFLIIIALAFPMVIVSAIITINGNVDISISQYLPIFFVYAAYVFAFAYLKSRSGNLVWNNTRLGPIRFQSTLHCRDLILLYLTNAIGIIVSFGMLIPWAVVRTIRYRIDNLQVLQDGELWRFQGSESGYVEAVGAETMDFFDFDLSL